MKVTTTDKMNEAFKWKDDKYRDWTTLETREKKVMTAVMVPLIISLDGAVHKDTIKKWKNFASDVNVDWVRMDGTERATLQCCRLWEVLQLRKLGFRGVEERAPR